MRNWKRSLLAVAIALAPGPVFAHTGVGAIHGLSDGFLHPLSGLDHLLAMILVGMIAVQLGGRALWMLPAAFIGLMAVGGLLGATHVALPFVEVAIALSVVAFGAAVALNLSLPAIAAALVVGVFAVAHGHAHGEEMPAAASAISYGLGFVAATAFLHAVGLALGRANNAGGPANRVLARSVGGVAAAAGLGLLVGIV